MNTINGKELINIFVSGAHYLKRDYKEIDDLNVFPVPDGDTGSNMLSTIMSGVREISNINDENPTVSGVARVFSRGLLFGARGNSGVILSQIFAGFSSPDSSTEAATVENLLTSLKGAMEYAYKSVTVPVEGTILTVVSDATRAVIEAVENGVTEIVDAATAYYNAAVESLKRTPELLPVLKEAGVVDSGGAGYVKILTGMLNAIKGEKHTFDEVLGDGPQQKQSTQTKSFTDYDYLSLSTYGYCTEFTLRLDPEKEFDKEAFSRELEHFGNSMVVVNDADIVKIHIHTQTPGDVFTFGQKFGALCAVKAENMAIQTMENSSIASQKVKKTAKEKKEKFGIVSVLNGEGLKEMFIGLGANEIIDGGQTMNPSTKDFIDAIEKVNAENVYVIPNNKNVYMSAKAAKALINDKHVIVVNAKTIPQGYAALSVFDPSKTVRANTREMEDKISTVTSGEITYAIRDSVSSGIEIKKNDFISIMDGKIIESQKDRLESVKKLVSRMIKPETMSLTVFYGQGVSEDEVSELESFMYDTYPDTFVQLIEGGQKIYSYVVEAE